MKLQNLKLKRHLSNEELIKFIMKTSSVDEDEDFLRDYFAGATATLREVEVSWLKRQEGMELRDDPHVYASLSAETSPPIIVNGDGTIEDGQHRYEAAKKRGDQKLLAYVLSTTK